MDICRVDLSWICDLLWSRKTASDSWSKLSRREVKWDMDQDDTTINPHIIGADTGKVNRGGKGVLKSMSCAKGTLSFHKGQRLKCEVYNFSAAIAFLSVPYMCTISLNILLPLWSALAYNTFWRLHNSTDQYAAVDVWIPLLVTFTQLTEKVL